MIDFLESILGPELSAAENRYEHDDSRPGWFRVERCDSSRKNRGSMFFVFTGPERPMEYRVDGMAHDEIVRLVDAADAKRWASVCG